MYTYKGKKPRIAPSGVRQFTRINLFITLIVFLCSCQSNVDTVKTTDERNSFINLEKWPDNKGVHINAHGGGFLFQDGKYYWFGEHKIGGSEGNRAHVGVHVYSSTDLYNWVDEGIALSVSDDPNSPITKGSTIERPKVIFNEKTQQYVMWFHLELKGQGYDAALTALAVSDKVTGPYEFKRALRPNAQQWPFNYPDEQKAKYGSVEPFQAPFKNRKEDWTDWILEGGMLRTHFDGGQMSRDMTLFVDDDGTAYHIASSERNQTLHIRELTENYLDFTGKYTRVLAGGRNEAPAIFKHDGTYYLLSSGLTGWRPNPAKAHKAKNIFGPWESLGNPARGTEPTSGLGADKTFGGQSTYILPVAGKQNAYIAMFDVWRPDNAIDGRYIWLPISLHDGFFTIEYQARWDLSVFNN